MGHIIYFTVCVCTEIIRLVMRAFGLFFGNLILDAKVKYEDKKIKDLFFDCNKYGEEW